MAVTGATSGYAAGELTNLTRIEYAQEVTYGVMPTDGYQILRHAGETIAMQDTIVTPEEINAAPEDGATTVASRSAGGSISGLLSYGTYDDFIAAVMGIDWVDYKSYQVTDEKRFPTLRPFGDDFELEFHEDNPILSEWPSAGIVVFRNLKSDDVEVPYRIPNSDHHNDQRDVLILSRGDGYKVLSVSQPDESIEDEPVTLKVQNMRLKAVANSNVNKSFTIRKKFKDVYQIFSGVFVTKLKLDFQLQQTPTIQIDFLGAIMNMDDVSNYKSPASATTTDVMQVGSLQRLEFNGSSFDGLVQSATLTLTRNGATLEQGIRNIYPSGVQFGSFNAALDLEIYFRSDDHLALLFSGMGGPLSFTVAGLSGYYEFNLLNAVPYNATAPIDQKNKSMILHVPLTGNPSPGGGTLAIRRVG